jgi:hypothetical protein
MDAEKSRRRDRAALRSGAGRAPAGSHFRAMGIDPDRLGGPIVGVYTRYAASVGSASEGAVAVPREAAPATRRS